MDIQEVLKMYNDEGLGLEEIASKFNTSRKTVGKFLGNNGYVFRRSEKKYVKFNEIQEEVNDVSQVTVNTGNNKTSNTVKCTFDLPGDLAKALKVKSAIDGVKMVKIVEEALRKQIESKYFEI